MAGKTVLSDGKDEIEVEMHERKEPDGGAVDPEEKEEGIDEYETDGYVVDDADEDERKKKKKRKKREEDGDIGEEEDEMADFVVDERGEPTRSRKVNKRKSKQASGVIREIDIPERMQISDEITGQPPTGEMSIEEESTWILHQFQMGMTHLFGKVGARINEEGHDLAIVKNDIMRFLELTHIQKLDVPFIAMYRKEECRSLFKDPESQADEDNQNNFDQKPMLRWHKVLWAVLELDRKWLLLQKRKSALQSYYNKRFKEEQTENQKLFDSITKSLKAAESEREIDDVDSKFNLHFTNSDVSVDEGQFQREAGLKEVATKFGYSSEDFGLLISLKQKRMEGSEPEEVASEFTCAMFENPQAVLRHMAAVEISCEPCVRKHVCSIFMDNAVVSTCPTSDGNKSIDSDHEFAGVKWLKDKPLTRFDDAQWLLIQKAEEEKLLKVTVKLPVSVHDKLISDAHDYYLSKSAQLLNDQRKLIIKDAFDGLLLPSMAKEARALLTSRAKNWVVMEYGRLLWDKVSVAPYRVNEHDLDSTPRVMVCCWGPGELTTTFVMLDSFGEVVDVLSARSLGFVGEDDIEQQLIKDDQQRVAKFILDHKPHVIVIGAVNLSCVRLKDDIYEIIFKMIEENPEDIAPEMENIRIVYGDESLPHLYENSCISSEQLPTHSGIVRRAVGLGRYLQNPLAMVATLCGPAKEILSWKLTPLQSFLTPDDKYNMVERIMVDATNQVGLDINLAITHEWLFAPLQFISGLGPRKAASLQRSLVRASSIYTRKDLLNHGLDKKVFVNAVGFLRVRRTGNAANSGTFTDLLGDTRIHPESYGLAQELAKDIYSEDVQDDVHDDDDMFEMAIKHVRENPNSLKDLDVDAYAESKNRENKKETLNLMRWELIKGFQDWRRPYVEMNPDQLFHMVSGETEDTLAKGRIVQATVHEVQPQRAVCYLNSGLTGLLSREDYTDDRRLKDLSERLNKGDIITAKVKSVQKNRYRVFLTSRESDLRSDDFRNYKTMDPYYYEGHFKYRE